MTGLATPRVLVSPDGFNWTPTTATSFTQTAPIRVASRQVLPYVAAQSWIVTEVVPGIAAGIQIDNTDPSKPVVNNTGVLSVTTGLGLGVNGGSGPNTSNITLSNTGVVNIAVPATSPGISVTPNTPIQGTWTLSNSGVVSATAGNSGISMTSPGVGNILISNAGVLSVTTGLGLGVNGGSGPNTGSVTLSNTGVVNIAVPATNPGITVTANSPVQGTWTLSNSGVLSAIPGNAGITITPNPNGNIQVANAGVIGLTNAVNAGRGIAISTNFGLSKCVTELRISSIVFE
jgi:hypothetical protein